MEFEDPLDLAQFAIMRVANIASLLGVRRKRPLCGRLGAELLLVVNYLNTVSLDQEELLRVRIWKLLRDVERICCWPQKISAFGNPLLEAISHTLPGSSRYNRSQEAIQQGLANITSGTGVAAENAILHIQRFMKSKNTKHEADQDIATKRKIPADYPSDINILAYNVLQEHMCCTCNEGSVQKLPRRHLAQLLLLPSLHKISDHGQVQFDILFSSRPFWNESSLGRWQDVQLLVPQAKKRPKKRARFSDHHSSSPSLQSSQKPKQVAEGKFCDLLSLDANSRICLTIQDDKLHKSGFEPVKQIVEHLPGISLADILKNYHLTARMKLTLAYILAQSVWQYYDSDWMKTTWTSKTIYFMKEGKGNTSSKQGNLYAWKPYLSVRFGDANLESSEYSNIDGEIHHYPRVRALGIMLVEIGVGSPLHSSDQERQGQPPAAKINEDLLLATQYSKDEWRWKDCDYPKYLSAVKHCLDLGIFASAPCMSELGGKGDAEGLKQRRNILYDKVIFPLEEVLQGTGWMEQLTTIGPLETPIKNFKSPKKIRTKSEKAAIKWLSRMQHLNEELVSRNPPMEPNNSPAPVRIAVLDTGYDDRAIFTFQQDNQHRLKGWKDWVDQSDQPKDFHGHGTHLVSLVMKIAPKAHLYIARVAKSPSDLLTSSENVAKAISWSSIEWEADIILMSFGYKEEQQCISGAIRKALQEREDSILLFAAASNSGANEKEMFPARHDSVISIRGTNSDDVPSAWLSDHDDEVYKSGTSIAAAVAAGIAGTLLSYIDGKSKESTFQDVNKKLRTRHGMQAVFRALAKPTQKERCLYLAPWRLMGQSDEVRWAILVAALSDIY
ncbi:extracellular alkaline serine protease [Botrytis cinerea]